MKRERVMSWRKRGREEKREWDVIVKEDKGKVRIVV